MNKLLVCMAIVSLLFAGCNSTNNNENYIADEDIDMTNDLIMGDESVLTEMPEYSKVRSGESKTIDRSFENAPPLIPHRVGGFLPIKADDNKCLRCHMPDKAAKFKATPLPETHFTSYRPSVVEKDGKYLVDAKEGEVTEKDLGHFNGAMFNCSQCHVPQAEVTVDIPNTFDPDYRIRSNRSQSNLKDKMGEGVR